MTKQKFFITKLAFAFAMVLQAVLLVSANSVSCAMVYEAPAPKGLEKFSRVK